MRTLTRDQAISDLRAALIDAAGDSVLSVGHVEFYNPAVQALLGLGLPPGFLEIHRMAEFKARSLDIDVVRVATGGTYEDKGRRLGNDTAVSLRVIERRPSTHAARFAFKLAQHLGQMCENLSECCQVQAGDVNIKATTTENLGFVGREEGIAAQAVVLIEKK